MHLPLNLKQENCGPVKKNARDYGWKISNFEMFDHTTS
jgi:hypothetical protein